MTETAEEFIARKSRTWADELARAIRTKDIGRQGRYHWLREAWTWHVQHNYREKVFVIERLRMKELVGRSAHEVGPRLATSSTDSATTSLAESGRRLVGGGGVSQLPSFPGKTCVRSWKKHELTELYSTNPRLIYGRPLIRSLFSASPREGGYHRTNVRRRERAEAHSVRQLCVQRLHRGANGGGTESGRLGVLPGVPVRLEAVDHRWP
jgi:hypothetical protein